MIARLAVFSLALGTLLAPVARAQDEKPVPEDINKRFEAPDIAESVERFESESREVYKHRGAIVGVLKLRPGERVADVGAGTGIYTLPFAEAVGPEGRVYAVDISAPFLEHIRREAARKGLANVRPIRGTQDSTNLPPGSIDAAFLADTYHHLERHERVMRSIHRALKPGGRLVLVEFDRREGESSPFILEHVRADQATFVREIEAAGFERVEAEGAPPLEENFLAAFRKVGAEGEGSEP